MQKLLDILNELRPDIDFSNNNTLIDDDQLDSFDIVTLVGEINTAYDIMIPMDELVPENFNSPESMQILIEKLLEEQ